MRSRPTLAAASLVVAALAAAQAVTGCSSDAQPGTVPPATVPGDFIPAAAGYAWSFPRDHWTHPGYRNEWWYFTGQLSAVESPDQAFGYQLTFFRVGILPSPPPFPSPWSTANVVMGQAALSDLRAKTHVFSEVLWREMPALGGFAPAPQHPIAWGLAPAGTDGRWTLDLVDDVFRLDVEDGGQGFAYHLTAWPERPLVFEGPGGLSRKSNQEGFASLYYSFTRMRTEGTITAGGKTWNVRGTSWMDREIASSQLAPEQVGWDWFALQLADGRDLMLYALRRKDGTIDFSNGTLVEADGRVRWLTGTEFVARATATWHSAATGADYPSRWTVEIPSAAIRLDVVPVFADQENRGGPDGGFYWEGAVRVRDEGGAPAGAGYVELTGYGENSRPPI